jgi:hypothetical protein
MFTFSNIDLLGFDVGAYMAEETRKAATATPISIICLSCDNHHHLGNMLGILATPKSAGCFT